jgi:hypothetical protein
MPDYRLLLINRRPILTYMRHLSLLNLFTLRASSPTPRLAYRLFTHYSNMAAQQGTDAKAPIYNFADKDGRFRREVSQFRDQISSDPNAKFPAEK